MIKPQYPEIVKHFSAAGIRTMGRFRRMVERLEDEEAAALLCDWDLWSLPYQQMPRGDWRRWSFRAGRGTGKTHTGARTVSEVARDRQKIKTGTIGIIGRTHADARHTMVEGTAGILAAAPLDFRPIWEPGNGVLTWPNGVKARIYSADKPEQMRGPNWSFVWADEPDHWPNALKTWMEVIEPALRIGWARAMLTSTPLPGGLMAELEKLDDTVVTRASTFQNSYLSRSHREKMHALYSGTRRGRQELDGEILEDNDKALWRQEEIDQHRVHKMPCEAKRIVISIDPAVSSNKDSDETGIFACALGVDDHGYVLADRSGIYTPSEWGRKAVASYSRFRADLIIGERNNGGDLVEANIRTIDKRVNYRGVWASRGKQKRAEPIAAMAERGEIHHVGNFAKLEEELTQWDPSKTNASPNRLDAVVWGMTELLVAEDSSAGPLEGYLQLRKSA
jgi:phage terminase large subunit-like protein